MVRRLIFLFVMIALLWPAAALAQDSDIDSDDDVLIRINGAVTVAADQTHDVLVVVNDDATVDGTVVGMMMIVNGTATINGRVDGDVVVIGGDLILGPSAVVENILLYDSNLIRDPAATISGDLTESAEFTWSWWGTAIFTFGVWIGLTILVLVAGLLFALFGGRQLVELGQTAANKVSMSILTAVVLLFGLPIAALLAFLTLVGIPLALTILFVLIPILGLLGYIVIGAKIGTWIRAGMGRTGGIVWATLIGLLILQLIELIPFIGGMIGFLAALYGAGVLVYHMIRRRGTRAEPLAPEPIMSPPISTGSTGA